MMGDSGKTSIYVNGEKNMILLTVRDDDSRTFLAMLSIQEHHSLVWVAFALATEQYPHNYCSWFMP
jgi:hypothetical protein